MAKRRGLVLLEEEMADPREAVAANDAAGSQSQSPVAMAIAMQPIRPSEPTKCSRRPRRVVGMLVQIERRELGEVRKVFSTRGVSHDSLR